MPDDLSVNGASLVDWEDLPEINRVLNGQYRFYGNYSRSGQYRSYLKKGNFIKAKVPDGSWQYFEIYNVKKNLTSVSVTARHIGFMANKNFIVKSFTDNGNGSQIMTNLKNSLAFDQKFNYLSNVGTTHQFTARQVAPVEAIIGSNNGNQNLTGVTSAELDMDNYDLKLVKQIGSDNGFRIDFGINLEAIEEEIDEESIVNSLYLVGGVPDNDYDEDKEPIEYGYLEIDGVTNENRRIAKRENGDCKTVDELIKWGKTLFDNDRIHEPKATHTVSMVALEHTLEYGDMYQELASLHFGDVAHVRAKELDIEIKERMVEYTYFPTLGKYKDIVLGNDLSLYTSAVNTQAQELKKKIDNRTETLVQNVLNATAWITGNSGGHVVFRPEKAPSEILIMDTPNVANAKRVWRWNLNGLGYSDNGVNGPFGIAITSKGEIVADFIKVGTINAEVFETSFNAYGDVLKLVKGTLQIWNENKKIMELTKKGMEFWNRKESIGTIGTTDSAGNPFPNAVTPTPLEENSLVIRTNGDGKYILISPTAEKGFVLLGNGKAYYFGDLDIQGKLTVRGKEVIPGQNGGPSGGGETPGGYPDELKTDAEKRAWRIYDILCNNGFTKQSACGILGNIQQETGGTFDPDTVQIGGPAYGLVQWDGSSYPLVGPATWDGKVYVQNLFNAAGIKEPITSLDAQVRLLIWTFTNGQWMGVVQPTTVDGFKACTDPRQAAYAFERNYERPAATHPERQDYAVNWYNKFKDLKPGGATGEAGLKHLESLIGQRIGNGQCYGLSAEYSGYLGGCGMGAGTKYGLTHVIGNTSAASDIGIAYDWSAVGWKVIQNPRYDQLVVGAIINWARGGQVGSWFADGTYGHTGVIRGLANGRMQTYEQNTELGMICGKLDRQYYSASAISSIVIPPK
nr:MULTISPECIES: phage tail tip lysozyme [Enterococcus]DAM91293.1 MAG TPA: tail protein [Caudoviricetes sp.]